MKITSKYKEFIDNNHPDLLPKMITIPIEDYNKLRALEIKQQIKRLKKELCELKN